MQSRRLFNLGLASIALAVVMPGVASAQGAQWDDAPADGSPPVGNELVGYDDTDPAALTDFNAELAPNGTWRDDATYGRVWIPHRSVVGPDFAPYVTSGHWAVADDGGWLWVSDYSFGWVVFHYGRWVWVGGVGWAWIPGRRYAHAWVTWRVADPGWAYVGWAPMPPDYVWHGGVAVGVWFGLYTPWVFCPSAYVYHAHMHSYVVHDHRHAHRIGAHSHRYIPPSGSPGWAGPSPARARIPAKAVPKQHVPANPKAVAASRQKASDRNAKIVSPGWNDGVRRMPPGRAGSRTLPGGSSQPFRSQRAPSTAPQRRPSGPGESWSGSQRPAPRAPSHAWSPSQPSPPARSAPPSRTSPPEYRSSPPSRGSQPSRAAPPSRPSPPVYRAPPPRAAPAPAPAPSQQPAAPSRGRPSRRR